MAPTPDPEPAREVAWSRPEGQAREEGGDPACWAHLFDEVDEGDEGGEGGEGDEGAASDATTEGAT